MAASAQELKVEKIGEVLAMIENRLEAKQAQDVRFFVEKLFERLSPEDGLKIFMGLHYPFINFQPIAQLIQRRSEHLVPLWKNMVGAHLIL